MDRIVLVVSNFRHLEAGPDPKAPGPPRRLGDHGRRRRGGTRRGRAVVIRVVDASAVAAVLFAEPGAEAVAARMTGAELAGPTLLPYEIASVCRKKIEIRPKFRQELMQALRLFSRMGIAEHFVP